MPRRWGSGALYTESSQLIRKSIMNILLYSPDNGVMRNFMPHLWMFLLQSLTPPEHEVFLIDGNAQPMTEDEGAEFVRKKDIRLVGIRREALRRISHRPLSEHAEVFFARPAFRGIY